MKDGRSKRWIVISMDVSSKLSSRPAPAGRWICVSVGLRTQEDTNLTGVLHEVADNFIHTIANLKARTC